LIAVSLDGDKPVVRLERAVIGGTRGATEVIASAPLVPRPGSTVYLKIQARGGLYDFSYGQDPDKWTVLARDVDGTILSTKRAEGFVGTYFGMYAHAEGSGDSRK